MKITHILLFFTLTWVLLSCQAPDDDIYILYDNDVHCSVEGYEKMAALRADYLQHSIYVNVVSCGDFAQGSAVGSISKGKYPIAIMNAVPYDYVTLGNHEFDYGLSQMKKLMRGLHAKCLCCNLTYIPTGKNLFAGYDVRSYGSHKVGFVGVATPATMTSTIPTYFQNEEGELEYDFHREDVFEHVQQAVNAARLEGAQYVVVLSHLGDDTGDISSLNLIHQTTGIDVVLDGHAHHVIHDTLVNLDGDSVLLASTGSNFRYIGCLMIAKNGQISNQLINVNRYEGINDRLHSKIESVLSRVEGKTSRYVGYSEVELTDKDGEGARLVRLSETNLGDFMSDAMRVMTGADIGVVNGGGLRSSLQKGNLTYGDLLRVMPFNNTVNVIEVTGQQLLDALEISVDDFSQESGDFLHVSGLTYAFNPSIPSPVHLDANGQCDSIGNMRRIVRAEVYCDSVWSPVCPDSLYTVGGQNYNVISGGSSGMFAGAKILHTSHLIDIEAVMQYIELMKDTIRSANYAMVQDRIQIVEPVDSTL